MTARLIGNSPTARVFDQIGAEMDETAANRPHREPYQYSRSPVRGFRDGQEAGLSILRLMDRLNVANGSGYRNLAEKEAAE